MVHTVGRGVLELEAVDVKGFPDDEGLDGAALKGLEALVHTKAVLAAVNGDLVKVGLNKFLLLDELDVGEGVRGELDGLVEARLAAIGNVNNLDDLGHETRVKHVGLGELGLELGGTSNHQARHIGLLAR